jgi:outer membrane protein assembly factor BamE
MFEFCRKVSSPASRPSAVLLAACVVANLGLSACSNFITPYRPEVVQGNFVSREQVQALRLGMPRQAVRDILGTPLVTSVFHGNRWDYAFTINRQGAEPQQRRLSVFFKGDVLERIEGDPLPTEAEFAAKLDTRRAPTKVPELKASEEILSQFPAKPSAAATNNTVSAPSAPVAYPPLESPAR